MYLNHKLKSKLNVDLSKTVCAPNVASEFGNTFTCFSLKELVYIAKMYNIYNKNKKTLDFKPIKIDGKYLEMSSENPGIKISLWKQIRERLYPLCKDDESCWLELDFLKNGRGSSGCSGNSHKNIIKKLNLLTFKPKKIHNERGWLSTTDIENVLRQYEELDKKFKFLGALPSDFYKIHDINLSKFTKYKKLGIVLNLDGYKGPGSHWVALYIDKHNKTIEYFDSTGQPPNSNIKYYIELLQNLFQKYRYLQNKYKHQSLDTECGVYSVYYIIRRLLGFNFESITSNIIEDKQMKQFRNYIFM